MEIFISWHGPKSHEVAEALRDWFPQVVNALKPWLSSHDIDKGVRWGSELASKLATSRAGIICLTPSNLAAPWILFEAGALSKTVDSALVCPFLIELEPSDLTGPLAQFQATKATKDQVLQLTKNLNKNLGESALSDAHLLKAFEQWWPELEAKLKNLPADEGHPQRPRRTDRDLIEELVDLVRHQSRMPSDLSTAFRWTEQQQETAFRVLKILPKSGGLQIGSPLFSYIVKEANGEKIEIIVPSDLAPELLETHIKSQIAAYRVLPGQKDPVAASTPKRSKPRKS